MSQISYIRPGEPVSASVANRPVKGLAQQVDTLDQVLTSSSLGELLVLRDMPVAESVLAGMPVYWNAAESRFHPAKAGAEQNCLTGEFESEACTDCMGLVKAKHTESSGDILLFGVTDLPQIRDFLPEGTGRFYLGTEAGSLTFTPGTIQAPIGVLMGPSDPCDERTRVYVNPEFAGKLTGHHHYRHVLKPENWKAASEFANAPSTAVYAYDIESDPDLKRVFPPVPLQACSCTIDWNGKQTENTIIEETFGGREIPVNEEQSLICIDCAGIWWMSSEISPFEPETMLNDASWRGFRITLHFSRTAFENSKVYVTSLQPDEDQPFEFVNCHGDIAQTGELFIRFTLRHRFRNAELLSGSALSRISEDWYQEQVPVIHGIRSTSRNLLVKGSLEFEQDQKVWQRGLLEVTASPYSEDFELQPQIVKLSEALESEYYQIQYLALPYSRTSAVSMKMELPGKFGTDLNVKMRLTCLAKLAGLYPEMQLHCIRLPRPAGETVSLPAHITPQQVGLESSVSVEADTLFELESQSIRVSEGDTLIWILRRPASASYASDVGLVRMTGILNSGDIS